MADEPTVASQISNGPTVRTQPAAATALASVPDLCRLRQKRSLNSKKNAKLFRRLEMLFGSPACLDPACACFDSACRSESREEKNDGC